MNKFLLLLALQILLLLGCEFAQSQVVYPIGGDKYSSATNRLFDESYNASKDSAAVPVLLTKIIRNSVDTRPLAMAFPKYKIKAMQLPLGLPDLSAYTDTVAVLWYLRNPMRTSVGVVNVMLIAQKPDNTLVYFVDSNNNRTFLDDGKPFQFKDNELQREVAIRDNMLGEVSLLLRNLSPTPSSPEQMAVKTQKATSTKTGRTSESSFNKRFGAHFIGSLSSGSGGASMFYRVMDKPDSDERNKSYNYTSRYFASLQTSAGIAVSFYNLYAGVSASYELSQVGEQNMVVKYEKAGRPVSQFQNNQGSWPYTRIHTTFFLEYDIPLTQKLKIAPVVSYSRYNFLQKQPFKIFGQEELNDYFLDRYTYAYGGKIKYSVSERGALFLEVYERVNHFDATSYFPDIVDGSFNMKLKQFYGGVGFQIRML